MRGLILLLGFVSAVGFGVAGCGGGGGFECSSAGACAAGGELQTCCNRRRCEYRANGRTFECAALLNCTQAAQDAINYCSGP